MAGIGIALGPCAAAVPPVSEAAVAALDPAVLYNFTDPTSLFVGRDGTGGNPSVGGTTSIGAALSKAAMGGRSAGAYLSAEGLSGAPLSAPGLHAIAPADNQRPILAEEGGRLVSRWDGVDDRLDIALGGARSATAYLAMALQVPTDTFGVLAGPSDAGALFLGAFGVSAAGVHSAAGAPSLTRDGAPIAPPDRTAMQGHVVGAASRVIEVAGADFSAAGWASFSPFWFTDSANYRTAGDLVGLVVFPSPPSAANRTLIRRWLASLAGVSTA